jgi:hypothetical protein
MEEDLFPRKKSSYDTTFFQNRKRRKPATFTTFCLFLSFAKLDASFSEEFFEISFFKNNSRLSRKVPDMVLFFGVLKEGSFTLPRHYKHYHRGKALGLHKTGIRHSIPQASFYYVFTDVAPPQHPFLL